MEKEPLDDVVRNIDRRLTRVEQILPTLATKDAVKVALREEGERTRRHFDVVAERLEGQIQLIAEGQIALRESMDAQFADVRTDIAKLDRRVTRLEAGRHR